MGFKYLKGIYNITTPKSTRAVGARFPLGLAAAAASTDLVTGANTETFGTFDALIVAGGGGGGGRPNFGPGAQSYWQGGGGGGAGGVRLLTSNTWTTSMPEFSDPTCLDSSGLRVIPVIVGAGGGPATPGTNSCIGSLVTCGGGRGGQGGTQNNAQSGGCGGSGGAAGSGCINANNFGTPGWLHGTGIVGQGCNAGPVVPCTYASITSGIGGSALLCCSATGGLTTSFTGASTRFGDGAHSQCCCAAATANRGNGGAGAPAAPGPTPNGSTGGSGIVAIRYRRPGTPGVPIASGGTIGVSGECIIHVFTSSGLLNVSSEFNIN